MTLQSILRLAVAALMIVGLSVTAVPESSAHLATFGSWEITRAYLGEIFPKATRFQVKSYTLSDAQVTQIEAKLGFKLYPEDRAPSFYIAIDENSGKPKVLGVAIFIDPRATPKVLGGSVVRLEVGVAVNTAGAIHNVRVFDYQGDLALTRAEFLDQLKGKTLKSAFKVKPVKGEEQESQLVADAAREALFLMKLVLGKQR